MRDLLRASQAEIDAVQTERMRHMLALCARGHPYYRRVWAAQGIDIATIRSLDDLQRLPLTPKAALMAEPEAFRLKLDDLPLAERVLWEVIYTTGSTGDPTPVYNTTHDYHAYLFQSRRVADISGIRDTDVIANLFPLTAAPMGAFVRSATNAYAAGAAIFAALPGAPHGGFDVHRSLEEAVSLIERHRTTILWGVPSFVRRVLLRAVERQADFAHVRMCALSGEASTPAMREELRRLLRALGAAGTTIFDRYGSTELGAFAQCEEDGQWHNPAPEIQFHEIVDAHSGARLPDGERGALAVTHLDRRGTVLIRFLVGDTVSLARGACPVCGRFGDRVVGPVVRTKDLVKVKGMLINPTALVEAMKGVPEVDEFQFVIDRADRNDAFSGDELLLRVAASTTDRATLADRLVALTQDIVRVRPRIDFVAADAIYVAGHQTKAVRFIDRR